MGKPKEGKKDCNGNIFVPILRASPSVLFAHPSWRKGANENGTISWGEWLVGRIPNLFSDWTQGVLCGGFSVSGLLSTKNLIFHCSKQISPNKKKKKTQVTFTLNPNEFVFSNYVFPRPLSLMMPGMPRRHRLRWGPTKVLHLYSLTLSKYHTPTYLRITQPASML